MYVFMCLPPIVYKLIEYVPEEGNLICIRLFLCAVISGTNSFLVTKRLFTIGVGSYISEISSAETPAVPVTHVLPHDSL